MFQGSKVKGRCADVEKDHFFAAYRLFQAVWTNSERVIWTCVICIYIVTYFLFIDCVLYVYIYDCVFIIFYIKYITKHLFSSIFLKYTVNNESSHVIYLFHSHSPFSILKIYIKHVLLLNPKLYNYDGESSNNYGESSRTGGNRP